MNCQVLLNDGHKYGCIAVKAAPLTMDEARKYADVIPNCDEATWLVTGWGGPEHFGYDYTLYKGNHLCSEECKKSKGVRPALVIPSSLLDSEDVEPGLEDVPAEDLLKEIRRRMNSDR